MSSMRTGADYRESLRDGRRVWVLGEGLIDDVTTHPATQPMVDEYVAWYDRHFDPKWQDTVLVPPDDGGVRRPVGYLVPRSADDLRRMGRCFSATTFSQSSSLPPMMVHTGPIRDISRPSFCRRLKPRSMASATAMHCGSAKETVALMLMPR